MASDRLKSELTADMDASRNPYGVTKKDQDDATIQGAQPLSRKERYIWRELCKSSRRFGGDSHDHKRLHRKLRYAALILTASSAVLAGLALAEGPAKKLIGALTLVFTAASGAVASIESLRKPAELWIHERTIFYSLEDLKREFAIELYGRRREDTLEKVFEQMQAVLGASADKWSRQIVGDKRLKGSSHEETSDVPTLADK